MTESSVELEGITLEDLKLPKGILTKREDGSYHIDADALIDFYGSDRGLEHFHKMEERLDAALEKKYEKKRNKLGEKWADAETDEDEDRLEKEETKIDTWYEKESHKINARMEEINRVWDDLVDQSADKVAAMKNASDTPNVGKALMIVVGLGLIVAAAIFWG